MTTTDEKNDQGSGGKTEVPSTSHGGVVRLPSSYDQRQCITDGHCRPPHRSRKDRKRWCGGHEGREHVYRWHETQPWGHLTPERQEYCRTRARFAELEICERCKRHGESRHRCRGCGVVWPSRWDRNPSPHVREWKAWTMTRHGRAITGGFWQITHLCPGCGVRDDASVVDSAKSVDNASASDGSINTPPQDSKSSSSVIPMEPS